MTQQIHSCVTKNDTLAYAHIPVQYKTIHSLTKALI